MDEFNSEMFRSMYTGSEPSPSQAAEVVDRGGSWKSFGTSMSAVSFGFLATAILMCLFLIMAIFEHLFSTTRSFSSPDDHTDRNLESGTRLKLVSFTHCPCFSSRYMNKNFRFCKLVWLWIVCFCLCAGVDIPHGFDARAAVSNLHCTTFSSPLSKRKC